MSYNKLFEECKFLPKFNTWQTPALRMLYHNLVKPRVNKGDDGQPSGAPKFDITGLIHKDAKIDPLWDAIEEIGVSKVGAKEAKFLKYPFRDIMENEKTAYKIREALEAEGTLDDYTHFIGFRTEDKPDIIHPSKRPFEPEEAADELYAGRWFRVSCQPYYYKKRGNEGVTVALRNVQLLDHDERLKLGRTATKAADEFESAGEEDDMPEERSAERRRDRGEAPARGRREEPVREARRSARDEDDAPWEKSEQAPTSARRSIRDRV